MSGERGACGWSRADVTERTRPAGSTNRRLHGSTKGGDTLSATAMGWTQIFCALSMKRSPVMASSNVCPAFSQAQNGISSSSSSRDRGGVVLPLVSP